MCSFSNPHIGVSFIIVARNLKSLNFVYIQGICVPSWLAPNPRKIIPPKNSTAPVGNPYGSSVLSYVFCFLYGTRAEGTFLDAGSVWAVWSSKKIFAPKALSTSLFSIPPKKKTSSVLTFQALSVLTTRS